MVSYGFTSIEVDLAEVLPLVALVHSYFGVTLPHEHLPLAVFLGVYNVSCMYQGATRLSTVRGSCKSTNDCNQKTTSPLWGLQSGWG